jgi:hypothetical protein
MKHSTQMIFADMVEEESSEDELDELFSQLLQIEPPPTLIDTILTSVACLPLPQEMQAMTWDDVQRLVARGKAQQAS